MLTVTEIAARLGVSKQRVSKQVREFIDGNDLPVERDGRGRVSKVSLAHFEHLRGHYSDPSKAIGREAAAASVEPAVKDSYDEAKRVEAWLRVEREQINRAERLGNLVRADLLADALAAAGREIQTLNSRLSNRADELAAALARDGTHGLRLALIAIAQQLNKDIADRLARLHVAAPETDRQMEEAES